MSIEQLRREVVRAITNVVRSNILAVDFTITVEAVRAAFDAYDKAVIAANKPITHRWNIELDGDDLLICDGSHDKGEECKFVRYARVADRPTFEGDEVDVREILSKLSATFGALHWSVKALALLDAKDAKIVHAEADRDTYRARAEQAEAALAEERKAMSEAASYAIEDLREWLDNYPDAYDRDTTEQAITTLSRFILPAKPAVDPLVEDEDPIDALVSLLAPVLTHGQGMAARERENRFRNALQAIKAGAADALLAQRSKQP